MEDKNLNQNAEEQDVQMQTSQTENVENQLFNESLIVEEKLDTLPEEVKDEVITMEEEVPAEITAEIEEEVVAVVEEAQVEVIEEVAETIETETVAVAEEQVEAAAEEVLAEVAVESDNKVESIDASTEAEAIAPVISKEKMELEAMEKEGEDLDNMHVSVSHDDHDDEVHDENIEEEDTTEYEKLELDQLVELMENLVKIENIAAIKSRVIKTNLAYQAKYKEFKEAHKAQFVENGGESDKYVFDDGGFQSRFNHSFSIYKHRRQEYNEAQELLKQANLKQKLAVLDELKALIDSEESLKVIYDEFQKLRENWRQIGMVPKNDNKDLWMNYNFLVEKFFEKVQIDRELRDIGYKKNLDAKIEIAEKTEALLLEKSFTKAFKMLQDYFTQWKEIGPVPYDKSEEIWERFKSAADKVNQRRREYYQTMSEEQNNNLILKNELIEKAEAISSGEYTSMKEFSLKSKEMDDLMEQWKKLGPAPKAKNDEVWKKFRSCFNIFFNNKRQYFASINDEQMQNYQLKLDICKTAESLQTSTDWSKTTKEIKKLQDEWRKIGQVPFKFSDKVWKRFRAACDTFFNAKEEFYKGLKDNEQENLEKKKELIELIKTKEYSADKDAAMAEMKELQKQWIEIGQVPFKEKDKINRDYRQAVDDKMNQIGLSVIDIELAKIKERTGGGKEQEKESRFVIQREISTIRMKIDKLKSEIGTWENNIGFFANSKNADVLKAEFQTKIDAGNKKIESMEARIRLLDKTLRSLGND